MVAYLNSTSCRTAPTAQPCFASARICPVASRALEKCGHARASRLPDVGRLSDRRQVVAATACRLPCGPRPRMKASLRTYLVCSCCWPRAGAVLMCYQLLDKVRDDHARLQADLQREAGRFRRRCSTSVQASVDALRILALADSLRPRDVVGFERSGLHAGRCARRGAAPSSPMHKAGCSSTPAAPAGAGRLPRSLRSLRHCAAALRRSAA